MRDQADRVGLGIAFALVGLLCMAIMDSCAKLLGQGYAVTQILLARNGIGVLAVLAFVVISNGELRPLRPYRKDLLLLRTAFSIGAGFLFFSGLRFLPLADSFAIAFTGPLFITALSVPILGEPVGIRRWTAVLVGFLGVLVVMQPGTASFRIEALLPLGAALCYALSMLVGRKMTWHMTTSAIMFWPSVGAVFLMLLIMPSQWRTPDLTDLGMFFFAGCIGTLGMTLITQGYRYAPAAVIAPFDYTTLIWAVILGWIIWGDIPGPEVWLGSALLIGSGLYILHRETLSQAKD